MKFENLIIVRSKTRLEQLIERFNTLSQAKFYIERSGGDFSQYEREHHVFYAALERVQKLTSLFNTYKILDRLFVHSYIFSDNDLIIVLGQDGLVANTAKYVLGRPIIGVNPDPDSYDGILLPFNIAHLEKRISSILKGDYTCKEVSMAEAVFSDGQRLLAFNDFYLGARSHVSSRYKLTYQDRSEYQSSSGILISTGAGSTGWMSSVFNMVNSINAFYNHGADNVGQSIDWESDQFIFAVREPFISKLSSADVCFGRISKHTPLTVESQMPENGVVFSDGIEADAVKFTSGMRVTFGLAKEVARLVEM